MTPAERLRMKMWQARAGRSRTVGIALLALSGVLLAASFVTQFSGFELTALASFIIGVFLISVELEPRVKLVTSSLSLKGPLLALSRYLERQGFDGKAAYVPDERGITMQVSSGAEPSNILTVDPVGEGLAESLERELGPLKDIGQAYIRTWVPKAIEKGLGLAEKASLSIEANEVRATFHRPYVRSLCVDENFNRRVCDRIGCPLVSSVGEVTAVATGMKVYFLGCHYEGTKETSVASYKIEGVG